MADSSVVNPLLWPPPPIHTEDPGSPPPSSILLDPYGYLSCRVNGTTAEGFTKDGKTILVTFWPATPPRVSCFTVHCPGVKPSAFAGLPTALYSADDLVLLDPHPHPLSGRPPPSGQLPILRIPGRQREQPAVA
ncbi:unnamed protein product [Urochloa humidicola]